MTRVLQDIEAISYFGNGGCIYDIEASVPLPRDIRARIAEITRIERRSGCNDNALSFSWDDSILEQVGNAGSRSELPVAALMALARSNGRIEGTNTGPVKATISSGGLKQHWPVIARTCGLPELPR